jgi:ornithine cyclodeaminase
MLVDVPLMIRLLADVGLESFLVGLTEAIEQDFRRWPQFEKSARLASHVPHGVIELMPAADGELYAFKFVNGHPGNPAAGKLTVTAFGALADAHTGYPLLLCEMTILTALRTAATSALAAKYLARKDSKTLALIGTGAQAEFQALAFKAVNGIRAIRYYDTDASAMRKFAANLAPDTGLNLFPANSIAEAVQGADIITTATAVKAHAPVITNTLVRAGQHLNAIGGDCPGKTEISPEVLRRARIVVEYTPQTRIEGEIQNLEPHHPVTELWRIITGELPGRENAAQITLFDSVGFAIEDFAALRHVHRLLGERNLQAPVALIPELRDPKDLYAVLSTPFLSPPRLR